MLELKNHLKGYKGLLLIALSCFIIASCASKNASEAKHSGVGATPKALPLSKSGNPASYVVFGKTYHLLPTTKGYKEKGIASWYGDKFHGKRTSSGDTYDMHAYTAAHKTLPIPSFVTVKNLENNKSITVMVNDRGPFVKGRIIDLSYAAAKVLGVDQKGTAPVIVEALSPHQYLDPSKKPAADKKDPPAKRAQSGNTTNTANKDAVNKVVVVSTPEAQNDKAIEASLKEPFSDLETWADLAQNQSPTPTNTTTYGNTTYGNNSPVSFPAPSNSASSSTLNQPNNVVVIEQQFFDSPPTSENTAIDRVLPSSSLPQYHIQLGSFSSESNARNFQQNMTNQLPYPVKLQYHGGLYKVYVGQYSHASEAENIAATLPVKSTISYF
ncbi:hypothetical protein GCM10007162_00900 [Ignatzschineria ureiclastica]|uniref:septal ring lytic transglycosylase RlpA family protein n=1 Tax=Ignatzschineria ureiclastica TaxID=472582 RepID=UPI001300B15E|nr:septal ring lytic transglycosylase RlpA family protein [Ignatzschineria ureiclastica]GGZ90037.1 hypothetical protein GCM10007162_00900 [Ignatzschineria ureiclastica]